MLAKKTRKILSLALVLVMVISMFPMFAMAEEGDGEHDVVDCDGSFVAVDTVAATCTEDGYTTYTCDGCDASYNVVLPTTAHSHAEGDPGVVTAPTETEQGFTTYTCVVCTESYTDDFVAPTGNEPGSSETILDYATITFNSDASTAVITILKDAPVAEIIIPAVVYDADGNSYTVVTVKGEALGSSLNGNKYIKKIVFPATITSFPVMQNTVVEEVIFSDGITEINAGSMFYGSANLSKVTLPSTLRSLKAGFFTNCTALESIDLPAGLNFIDASAFTGTGIKSITLPAGVSAINVGTFRNCKSLESVVVEGALTTIGSDAFNGCTNLKTVEVKGLSALTEIGIYAFAGCTSLTSLSFPQGSTVGAVEDFAFCSPWTGCAELTTFGLTVTGTVGYGSFYGANKLSSIDIAPSVTAIDAYAFMSCTRLKIDLDLPNITSIGNSAFDGCWQLQSVEIGDSIETIGASAFAGAGAFAEAGELKITIDAMQSQVTVGADAFKSPREAFGDTWPATIVTWLKEDIDLTSGDAISEVAGALTLQDAVNAAAASGDVVVLEKNVIIKDTITVPAGENVTIKAEDDCSIYYDFETTGTASTRMFTVQSDATLIIDGVTIDGLLRSKTIIRVEAGGALVLKDGKISGSSGSAAVYVTGGTFDMSGGRISGNNATSNSSVMGGGVYVTSGSTFTMTGGEISGNKSQGGGGVSLHNITAGVRATFILDGGTISGNTAIGSNNGGGGVCAAGYVDFIMNSGTISNNTASGSGGGFAFAIPSNWGSEDLGSFTMNGGTISGNTATSSGGGIYLATNNATITAGNIIGNTSGNLGGGIYQENDAVALQLYNTVITGNTATVMGGGLWTCPKGTATTLVTDGGAIFNNTANGAGDDFVALSFNLTGNATLSNRILGGGYCGWYKDGSVSVGGYNQTGSATGGARYNAETAEEVTALTASPNTHALKAVLSGDSAALARSKATVIISGNTASRGGGIGANGAVQIGTSSDDLIELEVTKEWSENTPEENMVEVEVALVIEGFKLDTVKLNAENDWTGIFTDIPKSAEGYLSVVEVTVLDGFEAPTYSELTLNEDGVYTVTVTNTYIPPNIPYIPTTPPVDIPDPSDPLTDIPDPSDPLTDIPDPSDPLTDIPDDLDPLGDAPKTGDGSNIFLFITIMISCAFGLAYINLPRKKKNED